MDAHVKFRAFKGSPDYVHRYLSDVGKIYDLSPRALEFLTEMIPLQKDGLVVLDAPLKKLLCNRMDCFFKDGDEKVYPNVNLIDVLLNKLIKSEIVVKAGRGTYKLPPIFDFSGELTLSITYTASGRIVKQYPEYGSDPQRSG